MTSKFEARGSKLDRRFVPPLDPGAEQVCLLDRETAAARQEPPDGFLDSARAQETFENGAEFRFAASDGMWERVVTFIDEERECCPFFAFEQWREGDEVVLRITRPERKATT